MPGLDSISGVSSLSIRHRLVSLCSWELETNVSGTNSPDEAPRNRLIRAYSVSSQAERSEYRGSQPILDGSMAWLEVAIL